MARDGPSSRPNVFGEFLLLCLLCWCCSQTQIALLSCSRSLPRVSPSGCSSYFYPLTSCKLGLSIFDALIVPAYDVLETCGLFFGEGLALCPPWSTPAALLSSSCCICVQSSGSEGYLCCPTATLLQAAFSLFPLFKVCTGLFVLFFLCVWGGLFWFGLFFFPFEDVNNYLKVRQINQQVQSLY